VAGQDDDRTSGQAVLILDARNRAAQRLEAIVLSRGAYDDVDMLTHDECSATIRMLVYVNGAARESLRERRRDCSEPLVAHTRVIEGAT